MPCSLSLEIRPPEVERVVSLRRKAVSVAVDNNISNGFQAHITLFTCLILLHLNDQQKKELEQLCSCIPPPDGKLLNRVGKYEVFTGGYFVKRFDFDFNMTAWRILVYSELVSYLGYNSSSWKPHDDGENVIFTYCRVGCTQHEPVLSVSKHSFGKNNWKSHATCAQKSYGKGDSIIHPITRNLIQVDDRQYEEFFHHYVTEAKNSGYDIGRFPDIIHLKYQKIIPSLKLCNFYNSFRLSMCNFYNSFGLSLCNLK